MNQQSLNIDRALLIVVLTAIAASALLPDYARWFIGVSGVASLIYCIRNLMWLRNFNKLQERDRLEGFREDDR